MEVYILDDLGRQSIVVDKFNSLIWTERLSAWGDFELILTATTENRNRFSTGRRINIDESYRIMTVETVEEKVDDEGRATLVVKGRTLEAILENRLARGTMDDLTTTPKWTITDLPADIARQLFHDICVTGVLDAGDIIAGVNESSIFTAGTIPEPGDVITYEMDMMSLYNALKNLVDIYNMGFRLIQDPDTLELHFDVYTGNDLTTQQTDFDAVVFSPGMDNLKNTSELNTIALYKNVAYVISPVGSEIVYALDVDPAIAGFERHVLWVKADDITDGVPATATAKMIQRGTEELARARKLMAFDGELSPNGQYIYGQDYNLGDLVELQNGLGAAINMQVTEHIFVSDEQGDRSYPTLSLNSFVVPGSWNAYPPSDAWDDVNPLTVWDAA